MKCFFTLKDDERHLIQLVSFGMYPDAYLNIDLSLKIEVDLPAAYNKQVTFYFLLVLCYVVWLYSK